ncbi:MAG: DNA repair protein RecO [Rehaibacterium terrae]|uniref:DNA repair protein RecO n=1 Tax=Rehaibacterium terrae TaxID=1341696 RepID=UPI0039189CBC
MRIASQPAWILHVRPWRETSALVELFTRDHGRVGAVARGIRGPRRQPLRAALQPFSLVSTDLDLRGELARLDRAEALIAPLGLAGDALLAGFYLNELAVRLLPRHDPLPALFDRYGRTLAALGDTGLAWTLRRFERDLLDALGVLPPLDHDSLGEPLDPAARYRLDPEHGALRDRQLAAGSVSGAALLALAADREPPPGQLRELREAMRGLVSHHLGPRGLRSWGLLAEVAQMGRAP